MANINVERKRTSVWTWVIGLVVAALLVWALVALFGGNDAAVDGTPVGEVGAGEPPAPPVAVGLRLT